jgi:ABC-type lipoprotein export system ATPase subunit
MRPTVWRTAQYSERDEADEPTAHLDRISGRVLIRLLEQAAHEGGTTVVAASHDPDVVSAADSRLQLGAQN